MKKNKRNIISYLLAEFLVLTGSVRRARQMALNNECILSVYFHKPTREEFEQCIAWLKKYQFRFLSVADIEKIMRKEKPFPKGGVLITVDDGWKCNMQNVIEVAEEHQVPVTIFVSTEPVESGTYWWSHFYKAGEQGLKFGTVPEMKDVPNYVRMKTLEEVKRLAPLEREAMTVEEVASAVHSPFVTIGGHTHTHPILINCDDNQVKEELVISKQKLENWTGKGVKYFSYPNGDYSQREINMLKELDYTIAFSDHPKYLTPDQLNDKYILPRFGYLEGASFAENLCRITGVWQPLMLRLRDLKKKILK